MCWVFRVVREVMWECMNDEVACYDMMTFKVKWLYAYVVCRILLCRYEMIVM